jgi:hypothetical protein
MTMARQVIQIKAQETKPMKLSPAAFIPAMAFPISNQTGVDIRVTVDGKNIRIEREES